MPLIVLSMHTLFALEDMYGLKISEKDGSPCLLLDSSVTAPGSTLDNAFHAWLLISQNLENGEITKEQYDEWRYNYPKLDNYSRWAQIPSEDLSDMLMEEFKKMEKEEKKRSRKKK